MYEVLIFQWSNPVNQWSKPYVISGSWRVHFRCKFCPDSSSFGIMSSQRGSVFQNSGILSSEKNCEANLFKFMILIFLPPVVNDVQIWVLLNKFWDDSGKIQDFEKIVSETNTSPQIFF